LLARFRECPKCGEIVEGEAEVCPNCGARLEQFRDERDDHPEIIG
jgi:RNA polymerase subunit RPABC4/transcription elongation factor Spt4